MQNLYELLTSLVDERAELKRMGGILKYDARRGEPTAKETFDKIVVRYKQVDKQIDTIEDEYAIGINEMGEIISKHTGKHYVPKLFREVYEKDGERYYSYRFIACYINEKHPYYSNEKYSIAVLEDEFKNLANNLDATGSIMFSNSGVLGNYKPLCPEYAFKGTNFIKKYIYGDLSIDEISCDFMEKVEPMLKAELASTNIITNDESFSQGL